MESQDLTASVSVTLTSLLGNASAARVYGQIKVCGTVVFEVEAPGGNAVPVGGEILQYHKIVPPLGSPLKIDADLYNSDWEPHSDYITNASVTVPPEAGLHYEISNPHGSIKITVSFTK